MSTRDALAIHLGGFVFDTGRRHQEESAREMFADDPKAQAHYDRLIKERFDGGVAEAFQKADEILELILPLEEATKLVADTFAVVHNQNTGKTFSVAEVKELVYPLIDAIRNIREIP